MPLLFDFIDRQFIHNNPPTPTASFKGKTIIVTGANCGLGLEASRLMVNLGASQIIMACRNTEKGKTAAAEIQASTKCSPDPLKVWPLDLSSYASVLAFADKVNAELPRVDGLLSNAGLSTGKSAAHKWTVTEGNEEGITTNVISMALLCLLLHPKLRDTAQKYDTETYITATASELYESAVFQESKAPTGQIFATLNDRNKANLADRYNVTKLLGMMAIRKMAQQSPYSSSGVIINCVAPGFCATELTRDLHGSMIARGLIRALARRGEVGARTLVWGASAGPESHGQYLPDCKITPVKGLLKGEPGVKLQDQVWAELTVILEKIRPGVTTTLS